MRFILLITSFLVFAGQLFSNAPVTFDSKIFYDPAGNPYLETHLLFDGSRFQFLVKDNDLFQAQLEVTIVLSSEFGEIADFRKIRITSPEIEDPFGTDFFDIQRISLQPGNYQLELKIKDLNRPNAKTLELVTAIPIPAISSKLAVSDIMPVAGYGKTEEPNDLSRSGFDIMPGMTGVFPHEASALTFYCEVYNSEKQFGSDSPFLVTFSLTNAKNGKEVEQTKSYRRKKSSVIVPVFDFIDISGVDSGEYLLSVNVSGSDGQVIATSELRIFRLSPPTEEPIFSGEPTVSKEYYYLTSVQNPDSLRDMVNSIWPICSASERHFIDNNVKTAEARILKNFIYRVFENRDPSNPEQAWKDYRVEVEKVNKAYGTRNRRGYETDRGRVYLQYGPPNSLVDRHNDIETLPYEIWHYYAINQFRNRRFVFYSPVVVANDFELIHSDMWGEVSNPQWIRLVKYQGHTPWIDYGDDRMEEIRRGRDKLDEFYVNPR
jgi:GWxTD domain-containing protein